jgi:hypothetical protein
MEKIIYILTIFAGLLVGGEVLAQTISQQGKITIGATVLETIGNFIQNISSSPGSSGASGQFAPIKFGVPPMVIDNGQAQTNSLEAIIELNVEGAYQMQLSNTNDFSAAAWEPFARFKTWELAAGDGQKTVWARFKNLSGYPSKIISGNVVLDTTPPSNVSEFWAAAGDRQNSLEWKNPTDADFDKVLIVRSRNFYPASPQDGTAVYDGKGESFVDQDLNNGAAYYYTAFAYDDLGNYASGAVAQATPGAPNVVPEVPVVAAPPEIEKIDLPQFDFIQNGRQVVAVNGAITVDTFHPFTISIPYESVPEVLKTMMVTLKQGNKIFSFLLRANQDKTAYEATLMPPDAGIYPFTITILDYKNQAFKEITGELNIVKTNLAKTQAVQYIIVKKAPPIIYILFFLLVILAVEETYRAIRKYRRKPKIRMRNLKPQMKI